MTQNKWYRVFGLAMILIGGFLTAAALLSHGKPVNGILWVQFGPYGLMSIIGGIGLLFLPNNIKLK